MASSLEYVEKVARRLKSRLTLKTRRLKSRLQRHKVRLRGLGK